MQIKQFKINNSTQKNTNNTGLQDYSIQSESLQRKADMANNAAQRAEAPRPNNTGMPDNLKAGIESLSGFSMDDVRVHYNSTKPATVQALAYTQGTDIHVAPGQEKCLPHEAWHVAQQMAGRVSPTTSINGMPVNDNAALEHEADVMGEKAVTQRISKSSFKSVLSDGKIVQRVNYTFASNKRPNPNPNSHGYVNVSYGFELQKDHIIPYSLIMNFLDKIKPLPGGGADYTRKATSWIYEALKKFYANAKNSGNDEFFQADGVNYKDEKSANSNPQTPQKKREMKTTSELSGFDYLAVQKATGWMPANVFLAPHPKNDEPSDKFDRTCATAVGEKNIELFVSTYKSMKAIVDSTPPISPKLLASTLKNLESIAKYRSDIWIFKPENWSVDPTSGNAVANKVVTGTDDKPSFGLKNNKTDGLERFLTYCNRTGKTSWK